MNLSKGDRLVLDNNGYVEDADVVLLSLTTEDMETIMGSRAITKELFEMVVDILQEEFNEGFQERLAAAIEQAEEGANNEDKF
jgi:hypothetical protein